MLKIPNIEVVTIFEVISGKFKLLLGTCSS